MAKDPGSDGLFIKTSSGSPEEVAIDDVEAFPSLEKQRNTITQLINENRKNAREGDKVYIIPQFWYTRLLDSRTMDASLLGPIDTRLICKDFRNLRLVEYDSCPYVSIPETVFYQLMHWYGLESGSRPVCMHLIYDANHNLVTEYNPCVFRVHHLVDGSDQNGRYYETLNSKRPTHFMLSRTATVKQLSIKILDTLFGLEPNLDISKAKFKIWYVGESKEVESNSILNLFFKLDPLQFLELPLHRRITPHVFNCTLKEVDILEGDFVVELMQHNKNYHWLSNYFMYNDLTPSSGTIGLYNLGNTCYMNSALQCLLHIPELKDYFLYSGYEDEINTNNPLGYQGHVAKAFSELVQNMFSGRAVSTAFSPTGFKNTIGHFNSMFSGHMQQDSQEFITFLLDGLHEDLNRIVNKPYLEKPSLSPQDDSNEFNVIRKLAQDTWELHLQRNDSVITDLFVGLYESTLQCPGCSNISVTFDPYNDLTLPLPVNMVWHCNVKVFPQNCPPCFLQVEMSNSSTYDNLKEYVAKYANLDPKNLHGCEIFNHQFYNNYESPESDSQYLPIQELISESDDVIFYEILASKEDIIVPVLNSRIEEGFRTPRLFGVPFFIVLSPEERANPGAIRCKIEKYYSHLSGGFVEFPLQSGVESPPLSSFPLLREKYPKHSFNQYQRFLQYAVKDDIGTIDAYFQIKVIEETPARTKGDLKQQHTDSLPPKFWTPSSSSSLNLIQAKNISELIDPLLREIYDYPSLLRATTCERREDGTSEGGEDSASNEKPNEASASQGEVANSCGSDINLDSSEEEIQGENKIYQQKDTSIDNINNNVSHAASDEVPLVISRTLIVCEWSEAAIQEVFSEDKLINWERPAELKNMQLVIERQKKQDQEEKKITLHDCLKLFSKREVLGMNDSWYCPTCKKHTQAVKQIQLWNTPDVLLIHLKRFENLRSFSDKIDEVINFPIVGLDMSPYLVNKEDPKEAIYDLVAVDNHYGGLGGGHYTAYAKNAADSKWYYFDDSRVIETTPEHSVAESAYLLFYMRRTVDGKRGTPRLQEIIQNSRSRYESRIKQMYDKQKLLFENNKTDSEELADIDENTRKIETPGDVTTLNHKAVGSAVEFNGGSSSSHENSESARSADYSVRSLEVGRFQANDDFHDDEANMSRRKLRILEKTYNDQSVVHSPASSISSDGADSISAAVTRAKSSNEHILRSPMKD